MRMAIAFFSPDAEHRKVGSLEVVEGGLRIEPEPPARLVLLTRLRSSPGTSFLAILASYIVIVDQMIICGGYVSEN